MGGIKFEFFIKFLVLLFVCTIFVSCSEEDKFGIGLERPEDANLIERDKKVLRKLRSESFEEMKERLKNSIFYRVIAEYEHKNRKTGDVEEVKFDFVAMCGGRVLMDAKGYTVSETDGVNPAHFFEPTADDGLIMMRVPSACRSSEFVEDVPDDFTPFVVWFDDIHKLTHGLGYATEDAYKSPVSQLEFVSASLERADIDAWLEWREDQVKKFKPIGFVKSPWGVSLAGNEPENRQHDVKELPTFVGLRSCNGQRRVELPIKLHEDMKKLWPNGAPDFWLDEDAGLKPNALRKSFNKNKNYEGGKLSAGNLVPRRHGILTGKGGGYIYARLHDKKISGEVYPKFLYSREVTKQERKKRKRLVPIVQYVDFRQEMRGFVACGTMKYPIDVFVKDIGFKKGNGFYINDKLLWKKPNDYIGSFQIKYFTEKSTHLWKNEF